MAENDLDKYLEDIGIEMDEEEQAHEPLLTGDDDIEDPLPVAGMIRIETEGDIVERCESFLVNLLLNFDPTYAVLDDKKKVISELRKASKDAETVYLATDPDREGEAISWHLIEAAKIPKRKARRVVFHEITRDAIDEARRRAEALVEDAVAALGRFDEKAAPLRAAARYIVERRH